MELLVEGLAGAPGAWRFIRKFAAGFASPLLPGDGYDAEVLRAAETELGFVLPASLREGYALFGRRLDLTRSQDALLTPHQLHVDDTGRMLVFRWEAQHVSEWAVPLSAPTDPDPPVVFRAPGEPNWLPFLDRLSVAFVEMVMSECLFGGARHTANRALDEETRAELPRRFRRLPMPAYSLVPMPGGPAVTWFEGRGAILREDAGTWLWAAASSATAIAAVRRAMPGDWPPDGVQGR